MLERILREELADRYTAEPRIGGQRLVEAGEELMAVIRVELPGVLAIQDDADKRRLLLVSELLVNGFEPLEKICHGDVRVPSAVDEPEEI